MKKLLEVGRKVLFYVKVLSGYEERRIRNYRLQLENRVRQAQERKAALKKVPEQAVLLEVRRMVEEMQNLNRKLEETEAAIEDYFKPLDKEATILMEEQLEGEKKTMNEMMATIQQQALVEKAETERLAKLQRTDTNQDAASTSTPIQEAQVRS